MWLNPPEDAPAVRERILQLEGIEAVRDAEEAARDFGLMPDRIGELVVTGDRDTVFGELQTDLEESGSELPLARLAARVRGAADDLQLQGSAAGAGAFKRNADLIHFMLR